MRRDRMRNRLNLESPGSVIFFKGGGGRKGIGKTKKEEEPKEKVE